MKKLVAAAAEKWICTVAANVLLRGHIQGVQASGTNLGGSSSWGYKYYHTGHHLVAYFSPQHLHFQPLNPLLREKLDNAPLDDR